MKYVASLEDFLKCYYNDQYSYSLKTMDYISESALEYILWDETLEYCENNIDNNVELYALFAEMFIYGQGVEKDLERGVKLLNQGIENGSTYCMRKKAGLILDKEIEGNDSEAFKLLERGAKLNCPHCTLNLGWLYNRGYGCEYNIETAYELYSKASNLGSIIAKYNCGMYLLRNDNLDGIKLIEEAANFGYAVAQNRLGLYYSDGKYVDKDFKQALYWFKKSALQDNDVAFKRLGELYQNSKCLEQDKEMAEFCYKSAIRLGNKFARKDLANMYLEE